MILTCSLAGLEKVLRLAQALSTVGASLATTVEDESPWLLARRQFNLCTFQSHFPLLQYLISVTIMQGLGNDNAISSFSRMVWVVGYMFRSELILMILIARRFFRLHKWIDHFSLASEKFNNEQEENAMVKFLDVTRNGFLGTYFFMEMGTIVSKLTPPSSPPNR